MATSPQALLRRLRWALWISAFVMATIIAIYQLRPKPQESPLPKLQKVPHFALQHHDGDVRTLEDLAGKPWVADFVFTRCPGVCPIMTRRMKELVDDMPEGLAHYVSVSVDPAHDTPQVLKEYAEKNGAGEDWFFLTGEEETVYSLIRDGFLLALDPSPGQENPGQEGQEPIVHSNRFVLVDSEGWIRGYYNSFNEEELAKLRQDLKSLGG